MCLIMVCVCVKGGCLYGAAQCLQNTWACLRQQGGGKPTHHCGKVRNCTNCQKGADRYNCRGRSAPRKDCSEFLTTAGFVY